MSDITPEDTLTPPVNTVVPLDIVFDADSVGAITGAGEITQPLSPPVETTVPLNIAIDTDSIGLASGVVELTAPIAEYTIDLNMVTDTSAVAGVVELSAPINDMSIDVVVQGPRGPAGPQGIQGEQGPQGDPGPVQKLSHRHVQGVPSTTWLIQHDLGFYPGGIVVEDSGGTEHVGFGVDYIDDNNVILTFTFEFGGTANLS